MDGLGTGTARGFELYVRLLLLLYRHPIDVIDVFFGLRGSVPLSEFSHFMSAWSGTLCSSRGRRNGFHPPPGTPCQIGYWIYRFESCALRTFGHS